MEFGYSYTKPRRHFGRQCIFYLEGPRLLEDQKPDKQFSDKYIVKTPVSKGVQVGYISAENSSNTPTKDHSDRGMNHLQGGWPKEVDMNDEEAVVRFRKKVERLDNYIAVMRRLTVPMEHAILQNNAINIYERYFEGNKSERSKEEESCRIQSKFRDPSKPQRPVAYCSWSPEGTEFSVAYCDTRFQTALAPCSDSYIWNLERPLAPEMALGGDIPMLSLEYNTRDPNWLVAGLYSGQVAHFDIRRGCKAVGVSPVEESHRDPAHTVLWTNSKSGAEFFSTSEDGVVMWWDCRHLEQPIEKIILDVTKGDKPSMSRAHPASCLEYEPSIPARYMVGTGTGYVIGGNRKGSNHGEKLPLLQKSQVGPIYSIHRNQGFAKNFLVVGPWSARIWSEDCRESPIIWTKNYSKGLTDGLWSAGRLSMFFLTRDDGYLDVWDILADMENPVLSMKLCSEPLTTVRPTEDGTLALVGNSSGTAYLVRFPSSYSESTKNDKMFLASLFDRESRREKLLEGRNREIKLRMKEVMMAKETELAEDEPPPKTELEIQTENYKEALESEYLNEIETTLKDLEQRKGTWKDSRKVRTTAEEETEQEQEEDDEGGQ